MSNNHQDLDALPLPAPTHFRNGVLYAFSADQIRAARREGYDLAMRKDQEGREPVARVELMKTGGNVGLATRIVEIDDPLRERLRPGALLYTSPPPKSDEARDAERWRMAELLNREALTHPDSRKHQYAFSAYRDAINSGLDFGAAIDAALAAQQKGKK